MRTSLAIAVLTSVCASQEPVVERLGTGCSTAGGPAPELLANPASPGVDVRFAFARSRPSARAFVVLGARAVPAWNLSPSCEVHVDPSVVIALDAGVVDALGNAEVGVALPNDGALLGAEVFAQGIFFHVGSAAGLDVTNALRLRVGGRSGPLASLPSSDGPHVAAIRALRSGEWLDLGEPAPDPSYGRATGRGYTPRMAEAPELGGAFLTGEGTHGYVIPATQRYVDDVWFHDLRAHRWICVKPGSHVPTISLTLNAEGFEVDATGDLVPVAQLGHGYEFVTFDRVLQRFFMQPVPNTYWVSSMGTRRLTWLPDPNFPLTQVTSPWLYDTAVGLFARRPPNAPAPRLSTTSRGIAVHWFASRQRILVYDQGGANRDRLWFYDALSMRWEEDPTVNSGPAIHGHVVTCRDPRRERLYAYGTEAGSGETRLWFLDLPTRTWHTANDDALPTAPNPYTTGFAGLTYDGNADRLLLRHQGPTIHVYDPTADAWVGTITPPPALQPYFRYRSINAYHDPELDVHVWHVSGSGDQTGKVFVFRS